MHANTATVSRPFSIQPRTSATTVPTSAVGRLPVALNTTFTPWSLRTFYLADGASEWKEVLITEYDM